MEPVMLDEEDNEDPLFEDDLDEPVIWCVQKWTGYFPR
jgi:hypothetical protein